MILRLFRFSALAMLMAALAVTSSAQQQPSQRVVRGQVLDQDRKAVASAVVHLKNLTDKKQLSVTTDDEGRYQFNSVDMKADYEIYAELKGQKSRTRRLSQFDTRTIVRIDLNLEPADEEKEKKDTEKKG